MAGSRSGAGKVMCDIETPCVRWPGGAERLGRAEAMSKGQRSTVVILKKRGGISSLRRIWANEKNKNKKQEESGQNNRIKVTIMPPSTY